MRLNAHGMVTAWNTVADLKAFCQQNCLLKDAGGRIWMKDNYLPFHPALFGMKLALALVFQLQHLGISNKWQMAAHSCVVSWMALAD